jgi:AcrR family transcriptional regulator
MMLNGVQSPNRGRLLSIEELRSWRTPAAQAGAAPAAGIRVTTAKAQEGTTQKLVGTKERQERERNALRRAILDAARELFVAEGFTNISMRKIADRIEYSAAAIYGYFPSKDHIYFALADEGFGILCNKAWPEADEPTSLDGLRDALIRFVEFSQEQPEYFALMFLDRSVPQIRDHYARFPLLIEAKRRMTMMVQKAIDRGELPAGNDARVVCRLLMSCAHGASVASVSGRLAPGEDVKALAGDLIALAIAGLRTGTVPLTFRPAHDAWACAGSGVDTADAVGQ